MAEDKKGIFKKIGSALSGKQEEQVSQDAMKEAAQAKMLAEKAKQEAEAKAKELAELKKKQAEEEAANAKKREEVMRQRELEEARARVEQARQAAAAKPKYVIIKEHTIQEGETPSHLALKYYGHATPPYWQYIIEVNKEEIGDKPLDYKPGKVVKIAELPPELKDK
jgi:nucleoid-associated protein YgaU